MTEVKDKIDKEAIRNRMSKAIGTFENKMVYNISKDCTEIAVEAMELYATAKAAQETEKLKLQVQAYELTVKNLRNQNKEIAIGFVKWCDEQIIVLNEDGSFNPPSIEPSYEQLFQMYLETLDKG
jgi:hypothetical protein